MRKSVLLSYGTWFLAFAVLLLPNALAAQTRADNTLPDRAAVRSFLTELSRHPERAPDARDLAFKLISVGRFEEASSLFEAVLRQSPDDSRSLYGGALALFNLKQIAAAKDLAVRAAARAESKGARKQQADALVLLAVILAVQKDDTGALTAVRKAVELSPESFDARLALGRALFGTGDLNSAVQAFREAARLRPDDLHSRFFLATTLEATGEYTEAQAVYAELIRLQPHRAEGHLGLGVLLTKLDSAKQAEAIAHLSKAVSINGDLYEARIALGRELVKSGRPNEALPHLERAAKLAPQNPEPFYQLSIAHRRLGNRAAAASASNRVKEINTGRRSSGAAASERIVPVVPKPN
ncbi:MAG TPA: tetratricopeptide repeat protein [Pyrinomonadaceae bacterium]|nr:tetratricopeptide repeat protein [Pyrinomonadaceae bacterium]